jgi:hypothetical protein
MKLDRNRAIMKTFEVLPTATTVVRFTGTIIFPMANFSVLPNFISDGAVTIAWRPKMRVRAPWSTPRAESSFMRMKYARGITRLRSAFSYSWCCERLKQPRLIARDKVDFGIVPLRPRGAAETQHGTGKSQVGGLLPSIAGRLPGTVSFCTDLPHGIAIKAGCGK